LNEISHQEEKKQTIHSPNAASESIPSVNSTKDDDKKQNNTRPNQPSRQTRVIPTTSCLEDHFLTMLELIQNNNNNDRKRDQFEETEEGFEIKTVVPKEFTKEDLELEYDVQHRQLFIRGEKKEEKRPLLQEPKMNIEDDKKNEVEVQVQEHEQEEDREKASTSSKSTMETAQSNYINQTRFERCFTFRNGAVIKPENISCDFNENTLKIFVKKEASKDSLLKKIRID